MTVLITGGAGFIGSHLAERCLREGWRVLVLDDLSTGSIENLRLAKRHPRFSCKIDSVFNKRLVAEMVDEADFVFHLAAVVGVRLVLESPVRTMTTNVQGTDVILAAAARNRTPVLLASTSEVYGKSVAIPFREDADMVLGATTVSRWSYACSKALDEFLGLAYWSEKNLPVTVVRFFNTIGPRQTGRYGMVLPTFVRQALSDEPITVYGDGMQRRCFGYVGDAVEALVRIARCGGLAGEILNVGNDREVTIARLAQLVRAATHSSSDIVLVPYDRAYGPGFEDAYRRVPYLEKLERLIGYRPVTPLETVIDLIVREQRDAVQFEVPDFELAV